jgi:hypothetical protein
MLTISPSLLTVDQLSEITEGTLFVVNQSIQSIMSNITELSSDILKKWKQYQQDIPVIRIFLIQTLLIFYGDLVNY